MAKLLIKIYQYFLSFDHSFWAKPEVLRVCVHYPSCSQYAYEAIDKFGIFKGGIMAIFRILRCTPLCKNRIDKVPDRFSIRANTKSEENIEK
ncbi:membrane protein insertion efficiency factor YidD [Candidatus Dojkabacteria bacterium]|nr:membrane protein insertion efficiency factor YidD [Candidatus Dojkabacteria bacterium]